MVAPEFLTISAQTVTANTTVSATLNWLELFWQITMKHTIKTCRGCKKEKEISDFYKHNRKKGGELF